jgi:cysteinyl-tRNA synthetase
MHGGGMDLMFPHHENELAQSESCTGKPFAKFWMHNGLTRIKTKLASGEWADEKMSGSLGNVVSAKELIEKHGAELLRYLLLSTHYRRPIEFSNDVISAARKGLTSFHRTLERVERIMGKPLGDDQPDMDHQAQGLMESPNRDIAKAALDARMKFLEMMDDDFNTAGAIAVMHEFASQINAFIEQRALERDKRPDAVAAVAAAAQTFRKLGLILGLFRQGIMRSESQDASLADQLMKLFIELRQQARKEKNFALADNIRNGLLKIGITLEDRPEGTIWRRE